MSFSITRLTSFFTYIHYIHTYKHIYIHITYIHTYIHTCILIRILAGQRQPPRVRRDVLEARRRGEVSRDPVYGLPEDEGGRGQWLFRRSARQADFGKVQMERWGWGQYRRKIASILISFVVPWHFLSSCHLLYINFGLNLWQTKRDIKSYIRQFVLQAKKKPIKYDNIHLFVYTLLRPLHCIVIKDEFVNLTLKQMMHEHLYAKF